MLHARKDYNKRVQDSESIIPESEPVFLLRGQDKFAPILLDLYAFMVESSEAPDAAVVRNTREHAEAMRVWQANTKCKLPDMFEQESVY